MSNFRIQKIKGEEIKNKVQRITFDNFNFRILSDTEIVLLDESFNIFVELLPPLNPYDGQTLTILKRSSGIVLFQSFALNGTKTLITFFNKENNQWELINVF